MASLFKRGDVIWIQYYVDGKQVKETTGLRYTKENLVVAKSIKLEKEFLIKRNEFVIKKFGLSLSQAFLLFEESKTNIQSSSLVIYKTAYLHLKDFYGDIRVKEISKIELFRQYLAEKVDKKEKHIAYNSIVTYIKHLRIFFNFLLQQKYIESNPFPVLKEKTQPIKIIPKDAEDIILNYLKAWNHNQYVLIKFLFLTGVRISSALTVRWEDIDFQGNVLLIRNVKLNRNFIFPLYPQLKEFLESFQKPDGLLFSYTLDGLNFWRRTLLRLKLPHYPIHSIRKTFLSNLANKGTTLFDLAVLADHRDIRTTKKYYTYANIQRIGLDISGKI